MTLRGKLYLIVGVSVVLAFMVGAIHIVTLHRAFLKREVASTCSSSEQEFFRLIDLHSRIADSLSSSISRDERVASLVAEGKRHEILSLLRPTYEEFKKKGFIREMTLFEIPAKLVVNVGKNKIEGGDVSQTRPDVVEAIESCLKVKAILICRNYVGIRATNPILKDGEVIGAVSVGIDLRSFVANYESVTGRKSGLAIRKDLLQKHLSEKSYKRYSLSNPQSEDLLFFTKDAHLNPSLLSSDRLMAGSEEVSFKGEDFILCVTPIKGIKNQEVGYFFTLTKLEGVGMEALFKNLLLFLAMYVPAVAVVIALFTFFVKSVSDRVRQILIMMKLLQKKDFEYIEKIQLPPEGQEDEIDMIERAVVELGKDIKRYIDKLSREVRDYTGKAYMDSLTGLFNRRAFDEYGVELIEKFSIVGKPMAVLVLDIDNFKEVNDTYGHNTGDIVLKRVAQTIRRSIRDSDVAFRYGGEEFVILLPGAGKKGALKVAEKIRATMEKTPVETEFGELKITVSIGATLIRKGERDPNTILDRADAALYRAKREGKNRVVFED